MDATATVVVTFLLAVVSHFASITDASSDIYFGRRSFTAGISGGVSGSSSFTGSNKGTPQMTKSFSDGKTAAAGAEFVIIINPSLYL